MNTNQFLSLLEQHSEKHLLFEYTPTQFVGANYHITEVKHIQVDSVDCGAQTDAWRETIIQLWESPEEIGKKEYMSASKALGILKKVGEMKPYTLDAEVKFEYSNASFHTANLFVNDFTIQNQNLIIKLAVEATDCKAKSLCGVVDQIKDVVTSEEPCCSPGGNCC